MSVIRGRTGRSSINSCGCSAACRIVASFTSFRYHRIRLMSLEEAILDTVRHLPEAKQEEVLRFADSLKRRESIREVPCRDRSTEMKWIAQNRANFADQWVAVEGDQLITAGADAREVFAAARAAG